MKRFCLFAVLLLAALPTFAQVIVDLKRGGASIRPKELADYEREARSAVPEAPLSGRSAQECIVRGFNALAVDSLDEARLCFEEALRLQPEGAGNYVLRHNLGRIALAQGRYAKALDIFTKVLRDHPTERSVRYDRAVTLQQMGNGRAAVDDCNVLLADETSDSLRAQLHFLRAAAEVDCRLYAEARQDLLRVLAFDPQREAASLLLVEVLRRLGRPQEALTRLGVFLAQHPESADGLLLRAEIEEDLGQTAAAKYDYEQARRYDPSLPPYRRKAKNRKP